MFLGMNRSDWVVSIVIVVIAIWAILGPVNALIVADLVCVVLKMLTYVFIVATVYFAIAGIRARRYVLNRLAGSQKN